MLICVNKYVYIHIVFNILQFHMHFNLVQNNIIIFFSQPVGNRPQNITRKMIQHTDLEIVLDGSEPVVNTKEEIALDGSERFRTISCARTIQN